MGEKVSKFIFLLLSILSLLVLIFLVLGLLYLIFPRLLQVSPYLALGVKICLALFLVIVGGGLFLIILSSALEKDFLFPHGEKQITLKILFPINLVLGRVFGLSKDEIRKSFIEVNNSLIRATKKRINGERLLILLSQCLQNYECPNRVTSDFRNCKKCGKCVVGEVIKLGEEHNASISIATGGTLARKVIVDTRPTAIVAVACERDLTSGIQDVYPIPVYGILNRRPFGPCFNTRVELDRVAQAVEFMLNGGNLNCAGK